MKIISKSAAQTQKIGENIAKIILKNGPQKKATILALEGNLGSGKTTFTQGLFKGLGIKARALSPTFIIVRKHRLPARIKKTTNYSLLTTHFLYVFHMDAYRIKNEAELEHIGFKEMVAEPGNLLIVEWPENIKKSLPRGTKYIRFSHGASEGERVLKF